MKKVGQFLLSFILPRKMARFRNMHIVLALVIYLIGGLLALGSQFITSKKYVKSEMIRSDFSNVEDGIRFKNVQKIAFNGDQDIIIDETIDSTRDNEIYDFSLINETNDQLFIEIAFDSMFDIEQTKETNKTYNETFQVETDLPNTTRFNLIEAFYKKVNNMTFNTNNTDANYGDYYLILFAKKAYYTYHIKTNLNSTKLDFTNTLFEIAKFDKNVYQTNNYNQIKTVLNKIEEVKTNRQVSNLDRLNQLVTTINTSLTLDINTDSFNFNDDLYTILLKYSGCRFYNNSLQLYTNSYFSNHGIYHTTFKDGETNYIDITVVLDPNLINPAVKDEASYNNPQYFNYDGYTRQTRTENTTYLLYLFGYDRLFYVYDLGMIKNNNGEYVYLDYSQAVNSIYQTTDALNRKYFLPKDSSELVYNEYGMLDTSYWTKEVGQDETFNLDASFTDIASIATKDLNNIKPTPKYKDTFFNSVYAENSRTYGYADMDMENLKLTDGSAIRGNLKNFIININDAMIAIDAANYEIIFAIFIIIIFVGIPFILALLVWIFSKKLFMKRFRQYYAIGSICYLVTGLLIFIVGFFVNFFDYAFWLIVVQVWYFIFVSLRINTDPQYKNDDPDQGNDDTNQPTPKEDKFVNIKEATNNEHKPAKIG